MNSKELSALQPADETATALSAAIDRTEAAHEAALMRVSSAKMHKEAMFLSGTTQQRREAIFALDDAEADVAQCKAIKAELARRHAEAAERERREAAQANREALNARIAEHDASFMPKYDALKAQMLSLLEGPRELVNDAEAHNAKNKSVETRVDASEIARVVRETKFLRTPEQQREAENRAHGWTPELQRMKERSEARLANPVPMPVPEYRQPTVTIAGATSTVTRA